MPGWAITAWVLLGRLWTAPVRVGRAWLLGVNLLYVSLLCVSSLCGTPAWATQVITSQVSASQMSASQVRALWSAPEGLSAQAQAQTWLRHWHRDRQRIAAQEDCAPLQPLGLDADLPTYAFEVKPGTPLTRPVVYVEDYLAQHVWFTGIDAYGCLFLRHAGRHVASAQRDILSPFPNFVVPALDPGTPATVLVQDIKGLVPVLGVMEATDFTRQSIHVYVGIGAISAVLLTILTVTLLFFRRIQLASLSANTAFTASLWFWLMQTYGLGEAFVPLWPSAAYFPQAQSLAVSALLLSAAWCVSRFVALATVWRRLYIGIAGGVGAAFFMVNVLPGLYGALMLAVMVLGVFTALLVLRAMLTGDRVKVLFGLGLLCFLVGGVAQTAAQSMLSTPWGLQVDFLVPVCAVMLTLCWFTATVLAVRQADAREMARRLQEASTDQLTGLWSRDYAVAQIDQCLAQTPARISAGAIGPGQELCVLLLETDNLRQINDSLGREAGSEFVRQLSQRIQKIVHGQCADRALMAYMGRGEFLVMLEPGFNPSAQHTLAYMLSAWAGLPMMLGGREVRTTVSVGFVTAHSDIRNAIELISDAYIALGLAHQRGRGQVVMFEPHMQTYLQERFNLEGALARAIDDRAFELHFQPIVNLKTGAHVGFEALVRWEHPSRGWLRPAEFIPLAEDSGLIAPLGRQVLEMAIQTVAAWKQQGLWASGWYVSVNVSGRQLTSHHLVDHLVGLLESHGLNAQDVRLEITESSLITHLDAVNTELPRLDQRGIVLCMDDFGTGYSSLSYLNQLPFQVLKIDKSFMDDLTRNNARQALVRTMLTLARDMKLKVVAEGIERPEQQRWLADLACDFGQGYLFSKPLNLNDARQWLQRAMGKPDQRAVA